jgi:hypothetical protein
MDDAHTHAPFKHSNSKSITRMNGMQPLWESYRMYMKAVGTSSFVNDISKHGVYVDAPDSTSYHPFIPRLVGCYRDLNPSLGSIWDTMEADGTPRQILPMLGMQSTLGQFIQHLKGCFDSSNVWDWTNVCSAASASGVADMGHFGCCDAMPLALANRTTSLELDAFANNDSSMARIGGIVGELVVLQRPKSNPLWLK